MFDWLIFRHIKPLHDALYSVATETTHQVILERQIEARRPRITLAATASAKLIINTPRFVTFGA